MEVRVLGSEGDQTLEQVLGYLNFSSGTADQQFLSRINDLFGLLEANPVMGTAAWRELGDQLRHKLSQVSGKSAAFQDTSQAAAVLELIFQHTLPAYHEFHRDLLFHQGESALFRPLFIGRVAEAVLQQGPPWEETERIVPSAIRQLNDYIGYRPLPTLESHKHEPYPQEWIRPIPLFIEGVGVSVGPHQEVVQTALKLLGELGDDLREAAYFFPEKMRELTLDPRAYDFDHPVNKRPNYHFGQWDPHCIDNQGYYRRFVIQQVTFDAVLQRLEDEPDLPPEELTFEAAAVLAGIILMASGVSGSGPNTHDSDTTLSSLLSGIANYRDLFYDRLFKGVKGKHGKRLKQEAEDRRQPFGAARQHLNAELARRRGTQLEHAQLAKVFARMGFTEAAMRQADVVPAASARMLCRIDCWLSQAEAACDAGELDRAAELPKKMLDLLQRGVQCGAVIDPWSILGFDAQFSLFPALENSIRDHRADELVELMEQIFGIYSRIWSEAAAADRQDVCHTVSQQFQETANWWRQFAVHEVSNLEASDPQELYDAAEHVARSLNLWHKGGAAAGDLAFWSPHADSFQSPKAYALVIDALLDQGDFVASRALLAHWLGQSDQVPLDASDCSLQLSSQRWLRELQKREPDANQRRKRILKFFDFFEANADSYWNAPELSGKSELGTGKKSKESSPLDLEEGEEDGDDLFSAAYEDFVYHDSTNDGFSGEVLESSQSSDEFWEYETRRIAPRLTFLAGLATMWKSIAQLANAPPGGEKDINQQDWQAALRNWSQQALKNEQGLMQLIDEAHSRPIPTPSVDHESLVEYDRQRLMKESLIDRIIACTIETADAARMLLAANKVDLAELAEEPQLDEEQVGIVRVYSLIFTGRDKELKTEVPRLREVLRKQPLLYVPLSKGGHPRQIVTARIRQNTVMHLLRWLPRRGMFGETCHLIETAREMERKNPVGPGAVTEFDDLFTAGYGALIENLVAAADSWEPQGDSESVATSSGLVECVEKITEALLTSWLAHSRTLRLSVLEKVEEEDDWEELVEFIKTYGEEIFTQRFFSLGNLRAILHQGVDAWLTQLEEAPVPWPETLLAALEEKDLERGEAVEYLTLVLEAVIENYGEYRDYNSTTTQSDRGDMLYTLLDFLRLRTTYDRVAWNLKPVVQAHDILVRAGYDRAAQMWRRTLSERINEEADRYAKKLKELQKKHAMRMPTVADRVGERFLRPMMIDRMKALVSKAMQEAKTAPPHPSFDLLEAEAELFIRDPSGVGLDIPTWLIALDEEVDRLKAPLPAEDEPHESRLARTTLSRKEIIRQINQWQKKK